MLNRANIWRLVLAAILVVAVGGFASAQVDARALMNAQRQQQQGIGSNGLPSLDATQQGADGQQLDANGNPIEGEQADSTKKKKPRKPLESYFFNDSIRAMRNFKWHISRDYNTIEMAPIDTTLNVWRLDYPHYHHGLGNNSVGGLGQASTEVSYFDRTRSREFTFSQPYDAYTYNIENVPFYNMKHPYIWMTYLESGQKRYREEHFEIMASQNINPSTSVSLNYRSRGSRGRYDVSRVKDKNFSATVAHTGRRYSVFAGYTNNKIEQQESGGVVGDWAITDTIFEMPSGVPMRLAKAEAKNVYRNNAFFIKQSIGIPFVRMTSRDFSMADLPAIYVGHTFEYNEWSKVYTDKYATFTNERYIRDEKGFYHSKTEPCYRNWFYNPEKTRDSTYERIITNRIFVQAQPWDRNGVVGTLDGGIGIDIHTYSQFSQADYLSGKLKRVNKTSWFAYAGAQGKIRRYADWGANFKIYPSGYRGGDYEINARASFSAYIKQKPFTLSGSFSESMSSPGYWQNNWDSNHYRWSNNFKKEGETRFNVTFTVPDYGIEIGFWQSILRNKISYNAIYTFQDEPAQTRGIVDMVTQKESGLFGAQNFLDNRQAITIKPQQHSGVVSVTGIYAQKDFTIKGLHLNHRVLLQFTSDAKVVPLPTVSAFLSYYYEFWVKRDVLRMQVGLDGRFNTSYYVQGYDPALSVFYNQNESKVGNYPYLDAFIAAKWKRMRILLKYQHWNYGLFGNQEFFAVARYPLNPGMFKIGISWTFYD